MKIMVWGAGNNGNVYRKYIEQYTSDEFVGFVDNNYRSQGGVASPSLLNKSSFDLLVVSNQYEKDRREIKEQLKQLAVDKNKVVFLFEDEELKTKVLSSINRIDENKDMRVVWLKSFAHYVKYKKIPGNVAECGVNRGEFAYYINKIFPDKKLYLMDTFEGFSEKDLKVEQQIADERFLKGKFNDIESFKVANVDMVKKRMEYLHQCVFCVGYFPESVKNVDDVFCFVNLDTDLYQPILAGLEFFYPRMVDNGIILVHDYFNEELPGVEKAICDYENKHGRLQKFPIADYCSLAIVK